MLSAPRRFYQAATIAPAEGGWGILLDGKPLSEQRHALASILLWIGHAAGIKDLLSAEENLTWL